VRILRGRAKCLHGERSNMQAKQPSGSTPSGAILRARIRAAHLAVVVEALARASGLLPLLLDPLRALQAATRQCSDAQHGRPSELRCCYHMSPAGRESSMQRLNTERGRAKLPQQQNVALTQAIVTAPPLAKKPEAQPA
jgi:hypothetical protein